jgi:hypothetical protein
VEAPHSYLGGGEAEGARKLPRPKLCSAGKQRNTSVGCRAWRVAVGGAVRSLKWPRGRTECAVWQWPVLCPMISLVQLHLYFTRLSVSHSVRKGAHDALGHTRASLAARLVYTGSATAFGHIRHGTAL